jgi:hypothetical protein
LAGGTTAYKSGSVHEKCPPGLAKIKAVAPLLAKI